MRLVNNIGRNSASVSATFISHGKGFGSIAKLKFRREKVAEVRLSSVMLDASDMHMCIFAAVFDFLNFVLAPTRVSVNPSPAFGTTFAALLIARSAPTVRLSWS